MSDQTVIQCDTMEMVNKTDGIFHDYRIYLPRRLRNKNDKTPKQSIKHCSTSKKIVKFA